MKKVYQKPVVEVIELSPAETIADNVDVGVGSNFLEQALYMGEEEIGE